MENLDKYRKDIDEIDKKMISLFEKRMETARKIGEYKIKNNLPVLNAKREQIVIDKCVENLENKNLAKYAKEFTKDVMSISRAYQSDISKTETVIAFQGIEGSFSYEASLKFAQQKNKVKMIHFDTMGEIFEAVKEGKCDYGVLPFENSTTGAVTDVYDFVLKNDFYITNEILVKVSQNLLANKGAHLKDIKEVYSHPQAIMQSKSFLDSLDVKVVPYLNTAMSAKMVADSKRCDIAAIGGENAAKIYGLNVLCPNINYNSLNFTKFVVIAKNEEFSDKNDKISAILWLEHKVGALGEIIKIFTKHKINLLKLESKPDTENPFEYMFFVDFTGNINDENVKEAMRELRKDTKKVKYLGNYKSAEVTK